MDGRKAMRPNHIIETRYPVSGGDTLAYDCEGNLSCVSNAVSGAVSLYWYDQHGRRVAKSESGLLTLYIWDGMDIIATAHADGTIREYFTRGIGIAGDVGSLVAETRFENNAAVSTTYLHSNWRGDVVMATDAAGNVVGEYSYTTFGEQLFATGTYTPRFTFSSKERDASGLVYHGFRYYSPVLCRWISEDPIRESGGFNLYQFCGNDPVNGIDPYGEFTLSEWKEIGGAFAEGFGKGIAAGVDGMIPFADPFTGVYADDCGNVDKQYQTSRLLGRISREALWTASGLGASRAINAATMPKTLYHFTSAKGAAGIAANHGIRAGHGFYGMGTYLTRFNNPVAATLQGARGTAVSIPVATEGLSVSATYFPGTYIVRGASVLLQ